MTICSLLEETRTVDALILGSPFTMETSRRDEVIHGKALSLTPIYVNDLKEIPTF